MKTVLILHGIGSNAGDNWMQWLYDKLSNKGYKVLMPQLPSTNHPDRFEWLDTAYSEIKDIDPSELIFIGHSLGVTTLLDLVEKIDSRIPLLISVSGFSYDYGNDLNSDFLKQKDIDMKKVSKLVEKSIVICGDDDPYVTQKALKDLADDLHVKPVIVKKGGHVNKERGYTKLPILFKYIK